ncbi:hypothetical protein FRAAL0591 [Frankia alni ACN14a]|uniref:Uncharacterized protein n=1 Tax=Frankia alni (strain DSM 45986 / CECT 9034 / ACN14a) TaxID=326424 RepID=Q0RT38_FRAAA|nr:hypothetical protein FRAAL0591 [Frankia alni ACN14a]
MAGGAAGNAGEDSSGGILDASLPGYPLGRVEDIRRQHRRQRGPGGGEIPPPLRPMLFTDQSSVMNDGAVNILRSAEINCRGG